MLSRVARYLYWLGRYIERAENTARLISVNTNLLLDLPKGSATGWQSLLEITDTVVLYHQSHKEINERSVLNFLLQNNQHSCALLPCLLMARENCRLARDSIPRETWERLNGLYWFAKDEVNNGLSKKGRHDYFNEIITALQSLSGLLHTTLTRDAGYQFIQMGALLERADMTSRFVTVRSLAHIPETEEEDLARRNLQWMSVLKSLSAYQMYRKNMRNRVRRADVVYFLLNIQSSRRSVCFSLQQLTVHCQALNVLHTYEIEYHIQSVSKWLYQINCDILDYPHLCRAMQRLQHRILIDIHILIENTYFLRTPMHSYIWTNPFKKITEFLGQ